MKRLALLVLCGLLLPIWGGEVRISEDGRTIISVTCWTLPDPTRTDTNNRANAAVVKEFIRRYPEIFAERYRTKYEADPATYGQNDWRQVEIELKRFSGIQVEGMGMDSGPLMAIAGGVAPDVMYGSRTPTSRRVSCDRWTCRRTTTRRR